MAAGNFTFYNRGKLAHSQSDLSSATISVVLLGSGYTPDVAAHTAYSDVSASEIGDADYTPQQLTTPAFTESTGTVSFDGDDISFGNPVSIEAKYAVFVRIDTGTVASPATGDVLLGYVDLNTSGGAATVSSTNSEFSVNTPNGLFDAS